MSDWMTAGGEIMTTALVEHTGPWTRDEAVIEVVSPSTVAIDRAVKPAMYAEAGVPVYWRVELHGTPKIVVCSLSRGRYVTRTTLAAGTRGSITRPFLVELDPADLTRRSP
jgi:hypothetical protein